jgi:hypothetical protein
MQSPLPHSAAPIGSIHLRDRETDRARELSVRIQRANEMSGVRLSSANERDKKQKRIKHTNRTHTTPDIHKRNTKTEDLRFGRGVSVLLFGFGFFSLNLM